MRIRSCLAAGLALALLAACADAPATDAWTGRWLGPEGTFLEIAGSEGSYDLTIRDLDGPRRFTGVADGERIRFERGGRQETLQATDGTGTGMKWLAGKRDCLAVRAGEGWCRD